MSTLLDLPIAERRARSTRRRRREGSHWHADTQFHLEHEPFVGYRVALATEADASIVLRWHRPHPAVRALLGGQRSVALPSREAVVVYDAAESGSRALGEPFPLRFTPVRCTRGRALPVRARRVERRRDPAPGPRRASSVRRAVARQQSPPSQACGALPVPALALAASAAPRTRATAERYVDTLIDAEPELHVRPVRTRQDRAA